MERGWGILDNLEMYRNLKGMQYMSPVQNNFTLYIYIGLANQHEEYGKRGDTEQFGNVQESERYVIHVSRTKSILCTLGSGINIT